MVTDMQNFLNVSRSALGKLPLLLVLGVLAMSGAQAQSLGAAPAWAQNITPGTWAAISQNTMADVDPADDPAANSNYPNSPSYSGNTGQAGVLSAWNGGALATGYGAKGSLLMWGGGHQDYYGNEVYAFDLATQRWKRLSNPYQNISFPVNNGIWPDGSPSVPHTYGFAGYHPGSNSFVSVMTQTSNTPSNATIAVMFDLGTGRWRSGPKDSGGALVYGGWAVYDRSRDAWWAEGGDSGGSFVKYSMNGNGSAGSWTNFPAKFSALNSRAAIDPVHDMVAVTLFNHDDTIRGIDLKNPGADAVNLRQGGSMPSREGAAGWEWSDARQAFLYWRRGTGVYEVKLSGSDWRTGTWTWTNLSTGDGATPQDQGTGIFNRFRLVRYDDMEIAVVVNQVNGPVYAYRVPGGGPVVRPNPPSDVTAN